MLSAEILNHHPIWDEVHKSRNKSITEIAKLSIWPQKKIWWLGKCGHEWKALIQHRTAKGNVNCPFCSNIRFLKGTNDLVSRIPQLIHLWDYEENSSNPADVLYRTKDKFSWRDESCGHR